MNEKPDITELTAFVAIVAHRNFRKAALELGLSPSTLSHMMRSLEARTGVRLLNRTTRSVAPTEAGERFASRIRPLLQDFDHALLEVNAYRDQPAGLLRINASEAGARLLMETLVPRFLRKYPQMQVDVVTEGKLVDIVAQGFDAGVRLLETVPQDMIAVKFGGDSRFIVVASAAYLAGREPPRQPDDLLKHDCIRFRQPSGKIYRWEFEQQGQKYALDVNGPLTLDRMEFMVQAAADGLGIAYVARSAAASGVAAGTLIPLLEEWCPPFPGFSLYYPGRRHVPAGLHAFIDELRSAEGTLPSWPVDRPD